MYVYIYIYIYIYKHITKSVGFEGFDSSRLLILRGGNYHIHRI